MKRNVVSLIIAGALGTGAVSAAAGGRNPQMKVLEKKWIAKLDTDRDGRVSQAEYINYGTAYCKQRNKAVEHSILQDRFNEYDRNRDGFITNEDPTWRDPCDVLREKIRGCWSNGTAGEDRIEFVFMDDGQADVLRNGESMRKRTDASLTYRFTQAANLPVTVELILAEGTSSECSMKCQVRFASHNLLKMTVFTGSGTTSFRQWLRQKPDGSTLTLKRRKKPFEKPEPEVTLFGSNYPISGSPHENARR